MSLLRRFFCIPFAFALCSPALSDRLDPGRDVTVRFSSAGTDRGAGFVTGTVANLTGRRLPCVVLDFELSTRFDHRQAGEPARRLGNLPVIVRDLGPRSARTFRQALPRPAGFGLGEVRTCAEPAIQPARILDFSPRLRRGRSGHEVAFHWSVENAARIQLFDDHGELRGDWEPRETGAQSIGYSRPTVYRLVVTGRDGRQVSSTRRVSLTVRDHRTPDHRIRDHRASVRPPLSGLKVCGRVEDRPGRALSCRGEGQVFGREATLLLRLPRIARGSHVVQIGLAQCSGFGTGRCRPKGVVERRFRAARTGPLDVQVSTGVNPGIGVFRASVRIDRSTPSWIEYCVQSRCQ